MIKITDKFVGLVNEPGYTHCDTMDDFFYKIMQNSLAYETHKEIFMNHLKENGVIAEGETPNLFYGQIGSVSFTWNKEEQSLSREISDMSIEDYNAVKEIHSKIDWNSLFPNKMCEYIELSVEEI